MNQVVKVFASTLALSLIPLAASADETDASWAAKRIDSGLVKPLREREDSRSRFSRVTQAPRERKVRVLSSSAVKDTQGRGFLSFAIDVRYGKNWKQNYVGCVYRNTGTIYVAVGNEYRPAEFLLGRNVKAVPGVCKAGGGKA